jgi:DNA-binding MarR family transcriptional regulator
MSDLAILLGTYPRIHDACRSRGMPETVRGKGLTEHQARILGYLDAEDPTMVSELAEAMNVTASTMSLNLKRLEGGGFLTRGRDPDDRRVMNVLLTEEGREVREGTTLLDPDRVDALLRGLGAEDRRKVIEAMVLMADAADRLQLIVQDPRYAHTADRSVHLEGQVVSEDPA